MSSLTHVMLLPIIFTYVLRSHVKVAFPSFVGLDRVGGVEHILHKLLYWKLFPVKMFEFSLTFKPQLFFVTFKYYSNFSEVFFDPNKMNEEKGFTTFYESFEIIICEKLKHLNSIFSHFKFYLTHSLPIHPLSTP